MVTADHCPLCDHLIFGENHTCGIECICSYCGVGDDPEWMAWEADLTQKIEKSL